MQFYDKPAASESSGGGSRIKSIGELRTPIRIKKIIHRIDEDGFNTREYNDVFKHRIWCRWTWECGTETFENEKQRLLERAVMLLRFTDKIDERCVVEREDAPGMRWEIISVNDIDDRHRWMEVTMKRGVTA